LFTVIACSICLATAIGLSVLWRRERADCRAAIVRGDLLSTDLHNVLDNLSSGLVIVDRRGIIQRMNPAAEIILHVDEDLTLRHPITDVFDTGLRSFTRALAQVLAGSGPVLRREVSIDRGDGQTLPVGVSVNPIMSDDGALTGAVAIFQDLSEINEMRAKMRDADQMAAVGELSAGIAHEIRNPLGSIRGSVEILAADLSPSGEERKLADLILRESRRVNDIITDFLSFARTRPARPRLVEVRPFLADVALQVDMHVRDKSGDVAVSHAVYPDDMLLLMDEEQMHQVLLNLAMNALEAMAFAGQLSLSAELDDFNTACRIAVTDTGPGVPPENRADLFKPFFTGRKGGTGLGLSVVKRIVHDHGGHVELQTPAAGGCSFVIVLPLTQSSPRSVEPEAACLTGS
jgi:two-component system, NtrC family, sensor histidine kinase PilS